MNTTSYPMSVMGDIAKNEEAVSLFLADARRGQSCVVFFNDMGSDFLTLPPYKQRMVNKMAERILVHEAVF